MGEVTGVEWAESSWTPVRARDLVTGKIGWHCEHVTEACRNCYAEPLNKRFGTGIAYRRQDRDKVEIFVDEKILAWPLKWQKPRLIFGCSMTDLFGEFVTDTMIDKVFAVMALSRRHTFIVPSKRYPRMREYMERWPQGMGRGHHIAHEMGKITGKIEPEVVLPLPNVWLGVSIHDQPSADQALPIFVETPAAVHFVSCEPLLAHIDIRPYLAQLDWVIAGGESGPCARPHDLAWDRSLRDQCAHANVAFFEKQLGAAPLINDVPLPLKSRKGNDWDEWPEDLRVREFPEVRRA